MSDFLSKFSGNNYDELLKDDKEVKQKELPTSTSERSFYQRSERLRQASQAVEDSLALLEETGGYSSSRRYSAEKQERIDQFFTSQAEQTDDAETADIKTHENERYRSSRREDFHEETEIDPDYQKKKRKRYAMISAGVLGILLAGIFLFYQMTHVTVPNFVGKTVTEARQWGNDNGVEIVLKQEYNLKYDANVIFSQSTKTGKKMSKNDKLEVTGSLGADPEEQLALPDFEKLSYSDASKWIEENKAENLNLTQVYSDTVEKGKFIKLEIANSIPSSDYTRGTKATLTYSRGQEVLEANIEVPDFVNKTKADVESWGKSNGIDVTFEEKASSSIAAGTVLGQSVAAGEKVAKKSKMTVQVSAGKGVTVPDFGTLTMSQASSVSGLSVIVRQVYGDAPYGALISQSQKAGTELTEKDDRNVEVVYSAGSPYIRDLYGKNEGDLQQYFYNEFRSKGAQIYFTSYYVNSDQPKGTVVTQNVKETWLPLNYTVEVGISNGAYFTGTITPQNNSSSSSSNSSESESN
ncbi:PASTA domain-containing protein [Streptococcus plurextorum]|uniref:PASTA domain-containing protein n=1 Tax=Streptococcus plurextorum TaxID=456876 RepID=UPI00040771FC|nr:PASTA domain-containing protein [Streptococcus plurextorum]